MKLSTLIKNSVRLSLVVAFGVFLLVGCVVFPHAVMGDGLNGAMASGCHTVPGMNSLCQMDALEHISSWQDMVTAIPSQLTDVLIAFLFATISLLVIRSVEIFRVPIPFFVNTSPPLLYSKAYIPIISPLQEAFSNGIVHSKVF